MLDGITHRLQKSSDAMFTAYATFAAFSTYFCMYAFRKPFAVGIFEGSIDIAGLPPMDLKVLFIICQVLGYAASKFVGIKIVSEMAPRRRAPAILLFIGLAELALVLFAVVPIPLKGVALVLNGLPLGMIWGIVFSFLEGRRTSDLLGAGLSASFIVASGFVKTIGKLLIDAGVSEYWMPAATGALFLLPLCVFAAMLAALPAPTDEDEAQRSKRAPMDRAARWAFFRRYALGLTLLVGGYVVLTAYRDFRDNFARELWDALGYGTAPEVFTAAELPVAFGSLAAVALVYVVKDSRKALLFVVGLLFFGAVLIGLSTTLFQLKVIGPATWMVAVGLGMYIAYVPYNSVLFDRLIAAVGSVATAAFLITVADAFGYTGSVLLVLYKNFGEADLSWLRFFLGFSQIAALACGAAFLSAGLYFWRRTRAGPATSP